MSSIIPQDVDIVNRPRLMPCLLRATRLVPRLRLNGSRYLSSDRQTFRAESRLCQAGESVDNFSMARAKVVDVNKQAGALADDVFASIHSIMHLFRSEQYRVLREGRYDLTHMEGKILGFFIRSPGSTLRDLVAHLKQDKGQLARLIRSLRDHGLLEAHASGRDRRSIPLQPTPEGRRIHQTLQRQLRKLSELAVKGLKPDERHQLVTLLDKVQSSLEEVRDASSTARRST
jgi:DNA-binding MarR family transcriptional regulator